MRKNVIRSVAIIIIIVLFYFNNSRRALSEDPKLVKNANDIVEEFLSWAPALEKKKNFAWWEASISGAEKDWEKVQKASDEFDAKLSNPEIFQKIKSSYEQIEKIGGANSPLGRQILLIFNSYAQKQADPETLKRINVLASKVEKNFNVYRADVNGKKLNDNEIKEILQGSDDTKLRQKAWEGSKGVGAVVSKDLLDLVRLRNEVAVDAGYKNYQDMALRLDEHDPEKLLKLMDDLDSLTRESFEEAKKEMDDALAKNVRKQVEDLRPWDYHDPFFQSAPNIYKTNLDKLYKDKDLVKLTEDFYAGIGLPVDKMMKKSSLFPQKGKSQHAFCNDMDREGDVRVLANIAPDDYWMDTMLHEFGHAVYFSSYIPKSLPFILRGPSHTLTTEGVAMLMGRLPHYGPWLEQMNLIHLSGMEKNEIYKTADGIRINGLLVFSRWVQVMFRFEKALYENPDQNLNKVWWDLVEKYQGIKPPEGRDAPDWASKVHIAMAPVYYHNYLLGELFASQTWHAMADEFADGDLNKLGFVYNPEIGRFLQEKIINPGNTMSWNDLTKYATGEFLNPKAYAKDVEKK